MTVSPSTLHSYFVLVPNLFNLPNSMVGMGVSMRVKALTLFASSKTAGCNYCSLHVYVLCAHQCLTAAGLVAWTHSARKVNNFRYTANLV
jgi:hypothetical protein